MFDSFVIRPIQLIVAVAIVVALFGSSEQARGVATALTSLVFVDVLPTVVGAFIDAVMQLSPFGGGGGGGAEAPAFEAPAPSAEVPEPATPEPAPMPTPVLA